jgi:RimJ/RimL family protein N-acetyltransferase
MILKTARLTLRPWTESDAESLYEYAKDPLVGPAAGWPVHTGVENSRQILRDILSAEETYAVTRKNDDAAIGSVGLLRGGKSNLIIADDEAEIGYWIGVPHWGRGYIPEAVRELMRHAFEDLQLSALWCGYFDGNEKSKRVAEKCGFTFHHTEYDREWPLINAVKTQHVTRITKDEWKTMTEATPRGNARGKR